MFNGRLLPVARLIERTFGKGEFRKIGEISKERMPGTFSRFLTEFEAVLSEKNGDADALANEAMDRASNP